MQLFLFYQSFVFFKFYQSNNTLYGRIDKKMDDSENKAITEFQPFDEVRFFDLESKKEKRIKFI